MNQTEHKMTEDKKRILMLFSHKDYVPMKIRDLAVLLGVPREDRPKLDEVLSELIAEGKIGISKRGKYALAETFTIKGTFVGNRKGFGFVTPEVPEGKTPGPDYYIAEQNALSAMDGDTVLMTELPDRSGKSRNPEGKIVKVIERAHKEIVATYEKSKHFGFAVPVNGRICSDIFVPMEESMDASTGERVIVEITDYGTGRKNPEGRVIEILGNVKDPGVDILSVAKAYGFENEFPEEVLEEVKAIPMEVLPEETQGRADLRMLPTVTIDGEDAKDLDDAITLSKEGGIYHLGVHIADVSHYVKEGSALDKEALKRATSVYLTDRVIPMLPKELSNGICSLNMGVDRLAFSCLMDIDETGRVIGHEITKSVIRVDHRMTYTAVRKILQKEDDQLLEEYEDFVPFFELCAELSALLREKRKKRGSIDFDLPESKILLDEKGVPIEIKPYERNVATKLIEDFMLMANETVAEDYFWQEQPFVYRTHENPDQEKIRELALLISNFGYHLKSYHEEIHPGELQKLLVKIQDSPEEALISRLTLRSMKRAKYEPDCIGHFGLAAKYYTHFTSPIRRYPDLQIHRIMSECLSGRMNEKRKDHYEAILPSVCIQCSTMERRADDAERETEKLKKCQYMSKHLGETFDGIISGVTSWGMYVELPNTVEGMVSLASMDGDYFTFDERNYQLVGEMTGRTYRLGEPVTVVVAQTDRSIGTIDFVLEESGPTRKKRGGYHGKR